MERKDTKIIGTNPGPDQKEDPLVTALVRDIELDDAVNFTITLDGTAHTIVNNTVHRLPQSVIRHLENVGRPFKSYVPGSNVRVNGKRLRFAITPLEHVEFTDKEELLV